MLKLIKSFIFPDKEPEFPKFDISNAQNEGDYWNAAWDVHKFLIADQFVQSSQMKEHISDEITVPIPRLTDANCYELSSCILEQPSATVGTSGKKTAHKPADICYNVHPSVFTLSEAKQPPFEIIKEYNYNVTTHICARYNCIEDGDDFEVRYTFFKPKVYLFVTKPIGLKLNLPAGYEGCREVFVIDKMFICEKMTATLAIAPTEGEEKMELKHLAEFGKDRNPSYGIPVCFSVTKYQLDENRVISSELDFKILDMRFSQWQPQETRDSEPSQAIVLEGDSRSLSTTSAETTEKAPRKRQDLFSTSDVEDVLDF